MWWSILAILRSVFCPIGSMFKNSWNWMLNRFMSYDTAWDEATLPDEHPEWALSKLLKHPLVVGIICVVLGVFLGLLIAA